MITLEHATCIELCFRDGSPTAATLVQNGTPSKGTTEPCDADNSRAKTSDTTNDRDSPRSSLVTGSATIPHDYEG